MALRKTASDIFLKYMRWVSVNSPSLTVKDGSNANSTPTLRFVQFLRRNDRRRRLGVVSQDGTSLIDLSSPTCISTDMITFLQQGISMLEIESKIKHLPVEKITDSIFLLPPITNPGKIVCVGLNYKDHCDEQKKPAPKEPVFFSKFASTLVGPRSNVIAHKVTNKMDWEAELAVVIGKKGHFIPRENAMDYIFGYAIAQDISARDWQKRNGGQFLLGKSMDSFCPLGPSIVHKSLIPDVNDLNMKTFVNGKEKQDGNTKHMIFKIDYIISRLSQFLTISPGDLILTGTPKGVGMYRNPPEYLKAGDMIETRVQYLGKLQNKVAAPRQ